MKRLATFAIAAAAALPAAGLAQDTARLVGTWECRVPGAAPTTTPPIVWFDGAYADGRIVPTTVDVDGFARQVYGLSNVSAAADGWIQVQPTEGQPLLGSHSAQGRHAFAIVLLPLFHQRQALFGC